MIQDLNDLKNLLKICRKSGVTELEMGGLKIKLGDLPPDPKKHSEVEEESNDPYSGFPDGILTPEQLAFYSAGGRPEEDPEVKAQ